MKYSKREVLGLVNNKFFTDKIGLADYLFENTVEIETLFKEGYIQNGEGKIVLTEKGRKYLTENNMK